MEGIMKCWNFSNFAGACDSSCALGCAAVLQSTTCKAKLYIFLLSISIFMLIPWMFRKT